MATRNLQSDFGKLRANVDACDKNNLRVTDCPCDTTDACEDVLSQVIPATESITSVSIGGTDYTLDTPVLVTDTAALEEALCEALQGLNGTTAMTSTEFDIWLHVSYDAATTTLDISHIGQLTIDSITTDASGPHAFTRNCTLQISCDYSASDEGTLPDINTTGVIGAGSTPANNPYNYVAGDDATNQATSATLQADVITALTTEGIAYNSVTVEPDDTLGNFRITVNAVQGTLLYLGDDQFVESNCCETFV